MASSRSIVRLAGVGAQFSQVKRAGLDAALSDTVRGQLISAIASGPLASEDIAPILAMVNPAPSTEDAATSTPSAAWSDAAAAPLLARAVRTMRLQNQYAEQLKAVPNP